MRDKHGWFRKTRRSINRPGDAHELTFTCYRSLLLLNNDRTRSWLIESIDAARVKWQFELWAFVFMPEHVHLLLLPQGKSRVSDVARSIKQSVARVALNWLRQNAPDWLPRLEGTRAGNNVKYHFWQPGGGYDRNIVEPKTAWASVGYLHDNPVRRGLVQNAVDWPWSSARQYAGLTDILLHIDSKPPDP